MKAEEMVMPDPKVEAESLTAEGHENAECGTGIRMETMVRSLMARTLRAAAAHGVICEHACVIADLKSLADDIEKSSH